MVLGLGVGGGTGVIQGVVKKKAIHAGFQIIKQNFQELSGM